MLDQGPARRPKHRALDHAVLGDHDAHRVGRDRVERKAVGQAHAGPRDIEQEQQLIGAVIVEEEIVRVLVAQLPEMLGQAQCLGLAQVQLVFPDVAVLVKSVYWRTIAW